MCLPQRSGHLSSDAESQSRTRELISESCSLIFTHGKDAHTHTHVMHTQNDNMIIIRFFLKEENISDPKDRAFEIIQ